MALLWQGCTFVRTAVDSQLEMPRCLPCLPSLPSLPRPAPTVARQCQTHVLVVQASTAPTPTLPVFLALQDTCLRVEVPPPVAGHAECVVHCSRFQASCIAKCWEVGEWSQVRWNAVVLMRSVPVLCSAGRSASRARCGGMVCAPQGGAFMAECRQRSAQGVWAAVEDAWAVPASCSSARLLCCLCNAPAAGVLE